MKKIIIACVAIAIAAVTQAATVSWTMTNVYKPGSSTEKVAVGTATAYLFLTANTTDVTGLTVTTKAAVEEILASGNLSGLADLSVASKNNTALGGWTGATGLTGFSSGSLSAFAVIVDNTDLSKVENYIMAGNGAIKDVSFTSASGAKTLLWGDQSSYTQGEGKWSAVPEPTSGLLLLLGMAGLALKRKVA